MAIQVSFPHDFRFLRVNLFLRIPSFCFHHRHQSPRPHTRLCGASLIGREPPFPTWTQPVPKRAGRLPKAVEMMLRIVVVFVSITEQGCSRRVGNRTHPPCFPIPTRERVKIHVGKSAFIPPYDHSTTESHRVLDIENSWSFHAKRWPSAWWLTDVRPVETACNINVQCRY